MTSPVARLEWEEPIRFDPQRLEKLCSDLGDNGAEHAIAQTFEKICLITVKIKRLWDLNDIDAISDLCKSLSMIAGEIGMTTLARVARDVRYCATRGDRAALAATLARLERICERSIHAIWSLEDISI